jgi:hypothetical protein
MGVMLSLRKAFMEGLYFHNCDAYVIYTAARASKREEFSRETPGQATHVLIHPPMKVCLQRAMEQRPNYDELAEVIKRFYRELELDGFDVIEHA